VTRQIREADGRFDLPALVKQRLAKFAETEAAAQAFNFFTFGVGVALRDTLDTLGGDVARDVLPRRRCSSDS